MSEDSAISSSVRAGDAPVHVVGGAILRPRLCLITRRAPHVASAGRWEFPGGKVEAGEEPRQALRRELREELAIEVEVRGHLGRGRVDLPGRVLVLDVYVCRWTGGELRLLDHDAVRWIMAPHIAELTWAAADVPVLPALEAVLTHSPRRRRGRARPRSSTPAPVRLSGGGRRTPSS